MSSKNKTQETELDIDNFVESFVQDDQMKADTYQLIKLMEGWSGFNAKIWGASIIGFGLYSYKYASGHEGTAPLLGFSPRKAAISLYVYTPTEENKPLLAELGKFKMGKACIYVKKLDDLNVPVLKELCDGTIAFLNEQYGSGRGGQQATY